MKRAITAAAVTVAMFAAGSTGLLRRLQEQAPVAVVAGGASGFLGPGGSGGLDGIISSLQGRLAVRPNDWRAQASLGLAYLQKGRGTANPSYFSKAEGVLLRSLDLDERQNFDGLLGMAALALGRHDFSAALEWSRRA